ncbi:MAG: hypothetical protein AAF927_16045 [Bacteroidota bacterium]
MAYCQDLVENIRHLIRVEGELSGSHRDDPIVMLKRAEATFSTSVPQSGNPNSQHPTEINNAQPSNK